MRSSKPCGCFALFLLSLLLHDEGSAMAEQTPWKIKTIDYRLPRVTIPESYEIKLIPEMVEGNFTFYGESKITVRILEETPNVTLHSKGLLIDENFTSLVDAEGVERKPTEHRYVGSSDFLVLKFDPPISPGVNYLLSLKFAGNMSNKPEGIYNSSYVTQDGERVWLVATKFTEINARKAFPCWDEPDLKATFNLSIKHNPNYTAESNMPWRKVTHDSDGRQWTNFQTTPHMSTYILAFVVSAFDCLCQKYGEFNVCGRKDALSNFRFSRRVSQRALALLEKYFETNYTLPKLSHFAVPDATTGATENWGLIIYRESSFAYDPLVHPVSTKEYVALTITHELAHQWIGNYITPISWKYNWIKEGLPFFLQYYIVDKLFPDWKEMEVFVTRILQDVAFVADGFILHKNLEWYSDDPAEIRFKFSPYVYNRGAVIFHMMSHILGEATFKEGVAKFVKRHAYGLFTSEDLWSAMQSAYMESKNESVSSSLSIEEIMKPWIEQLGYPLVKVTRDYETGKIVVKQQGNLDTERSNRWWIPINFATSSNPDFTITTPSHWLKPDDEILTINGVDKDDWIIVNIQQSGHYRVDYDETNWKRIAEYMNSENYTKIHVRNRAQLINDLFFMASSHRQNYTTFMDLLRYLVREDDYQPWLRTIDAIKSLRQEIYNGIVDEELKKFIIGLMEKVIKKIGFGVCDDCEQKSTTVIDTPLQTISEDLASCRAETVEDTTTKTEDMLTKRYRTQLLSFVCSLGHTMCLESAKSQLQAYIQNPTENPISADILSWVKCHGAAGSEEDLLKKINGSDIKYLGYLGCSSNKTVLQQYVDQIVVGKVNATTKQLKTAIGYLCGDGSTNLENTVNYVIKNYEQIVERVKELAEAEKSSTDVTVYMGLLVLDFVGRGRTMEQMRTIEKLCEITVTEEHELHQPIRTAIAKRETAIQLGDANTPIFAEWLHDNSLNALVDTQFNS